MIRTAQHLATLGPDEHRQIRIRSAVPGAGDVKFLDHLQKKFSHQVGFLPMQALEVKIARGQVSIALENDEPAAYLLGQSNYQRDPHFGIIYQAAVSYDARRRLIGTALVQHFMDHMEPKVRLIGLWCAQDIEANDFWQACGFEPIAARHGSQRKGRVHIFWVGRTAKGAREPMRFPKATRGGLLRERREVFEITKGQQYTDVVLPEYKPVEGASAVASGVRGGTARKTKAQILAEQQRAFFYGNARHIVVVINGVTKYLPVAPLEIPDFTDLGRVMVAKAA